MTANPLHNFITRQLDDTIWILYSAYPDKKMAHYVITLQAKKNTKVGEQTIAKAGYIRGILEPTNECLRVILYISPEYATTRCGTMLLESISLRDIVIPKAAEQRKAITVLSNSYVPEKTKCQKLKMVEKHVKSLKQQLVNELQYHPDYGHKYKEWINSEEFKQRWPKL